MLEDRIVDAIEFKLKVIHEFIDARFYYVCCSQLAERCAQLFQLVVRRAGNISCDPVQAVECSFYAEVNGPRETAVEYDHVDDVFLLNKPMGSVVDIAGIKRYQQGAPVHVVHGCAYIGYLREQMKIFHMEQPRGFICTLEIFAQAPEVVAFTALHGFRNNA